MTTFMCLVVVGSTKASLKPKKACLGCLVTFSNQAFSITGTVKTQILFLTVVSRTQLQKHTLSTIYICCIKQGFNAGWGYTLQHDFESEKRFQEMADLLTLSITKPNLV